MYGRGAQRARGQAVFRGLRTEGALFDEELAEANLLNHKTEVKGGVAEAECSAILTEFFSSMRKRAKEEKERRKNIPENNLGESGGNG